MGRKQREQVCEGVGRSEVGVLVGVLWRDGRVGRVGFVVEEKEERR